MSGTINTTTITGTDGFVSKQQQATQLIDSHRRARPVLSAGNTYPCPAAPVPILGSRIFNAASCLCLPVLRSSINQHTLNAFSLPSEHSRALCCKFKTITNGMLSWRHVNRWRLLIGGLKTRASTSVADVNCSPSCTFQCMMNAMMQLRARIAIAMNFTPGSMKRKPAFLGPVKLLRMSL